MHELFSAVTLGINQWQFYLTDPELTVHVLTAGSLKGSDILLTIWPSWNSLTQ